MSKELRNARELNQQQGGVTAAPKHTKSVTAIEAKEPDCRTIIIDTAAHNSQESLNHLTNLKSITAKPSKKDLKIRALQLTSQTNSEKERHNLLNEQK